MIRLQRYFLVTDKTIDRKAVTFVIINAHEMPRMRMRLHWYESEYQYRFFCQG